MSSMTIRNIDADVKKGLRMRAAENGRSMEEEVRLILRAALFANPLPKPSDDDDARVARLLALARTPSEPFDQKRATDDLWSFAE